MSQCEMVAATGDTKGKIFVWRDFEKQESVFKELFHWHQHSPELTLF